MTIYRMMPNLYSFIRCCAISAIPFEILRGGGRTPFVSICLHSAPLRISNGIAPSHIRELINAPSGPVTKCTYISTCSSVLEDLWNLSLFKHSQKRLPWPMTLTYIRFLVKVKVNLYAKMECCKSIIPAVNDMVWLTLPVSAFDLDLWPTTLTFDAILVWATVNPHATNWG